MELIWQIGKFLQSIMNYVRIKHWQWLEIRESNNVEYKSAFFFKKTNLSNCVLHLTLCKFGSWVALLASAISVCVHFSKWCECESNHRLPSERGYYCRPSNLQEGYSMLYLRLYLHAVDHPYLVFEEKCLSLFKNLSSIYFLLPCV